LSVNLGVAPTLDSLNYAAASIIMAGHAANRYVYACPGSIGEFRDLNAWRFTLEAGRRLGGHGSMCIHPAQVALANEVFTPSMAEVEWATRVLGVWESGNGQGALEMDGKMIDLPVVQRARNVLARMPGNIERSACQRET
jgi:citrate lyase subunit beta/citryl-CoA lyase